MFRELENEKTFLRNFFEALASDIFEIFSDIENVDNVVYNKYDTISYRLKIHG